MKLLTKTTLIIVTISLFIFFFGGIGFYSVIRSTINQQVDKELKTEMKDVIFNLKQNPGMPIDYFVRPNKVEIIETSLKSNTDQAFRDTILYNRSSRLYTLFRSYSSDAFIKDKNYRISVFKSTLSTDELIEKIILTFTLMALTLILALILFNKYSFRKIWNDFFYSLEKIQSYAIKHEKSLKLPNSEIDEFNTLNSCIERMTERIYQDYLSLKEFTENASHEIQTPLSVMRAKIELLLQMENLNDEQIQLIASLYESTNRLSNLNKTLILLTRIENNQFPEKKKINLKKRIEYHLVNFEEPIESKEISLTTNFNDPTEIEINTELFDILLINLIKNAIRHNYPKGEIQIKTTTNSFEITNTGPAPSVAPEKLFNRFTKSNRSKKSLGLGLSLVKKICELYNFEIEYTYHNQNHFIRILFK